MRNAILFLLVVLIAAGCKKNHDDVQTYPATFKYSQFGDFSDVISFDTTGRIQVPTSDPSYQYALTADSLFRSYYNALFKGYNVKFTLNSPTQVTLHADGKADKSYPCTTVGNQITIQIDSTETTVFELDPGKSIKRHWCTGAMHSSTYSQLVQMNVASYTPEKLAAQRAASKKNLFIGDINDTTSVRTFDEVYLPE